MSTLFSRNADGDVSSRDLEDVCLSPGNDPLSIVSPAAGRRPEHAPTRSHFSCYYTVRLPPCSEGHPVFPFACVDTILPTNEQRLLSCVSGQRTGRTVLLEHDGTLTRLVLFHLCTMPLCSTNIPLIT